MEIPYLMSTQHPDNAFMPDWAGWKFERREEIREVFYAYSIGCDEQLWDWEGKEVDSTVVMKLFTKFKEFFEANMLGKDVFLTYRVPNPDVQKNDTKALVEALESIPRNFEIASKFYGKDIAPIFEVAVPMTTNASQLLRILKFYERCVVGKENEKVFDVEVKEWLGEFKPKTISIIPLIEDMDSVFRTDEILRKFVEETERKEMRVWFARSDTALNYGLIPAELLLKIGIKKVREVSVELDASFYPILATGSLPFRGFMRPERMERFVKSHKEFWTFGFQSSMKYDFHQIEIKRAIKVAKDRKRIQSQDFRVEIEEDEIKRIIQIFKSAYQESLKPLANLINRVAKFVPSRRSRVLHVGLFGYSRQLENGIKLPRAIRFTASLYSIGIPPEIFGMRSLAKLEEEGYFDTIKKLFPELKEFLLFSFKYLNKDNLKILRKSGYDVEKIVEDVETVHQFFNVNGTPESRHEFLTSSILTSLLASSRPKIRELIEECAKIRRSLG
ncbi:MAG: phosphoenolpyruvate carboxylase [Candidatus Aenigmarchaeota archaeon]|nr:phosphoenolpyruvate carboxylase [Candidatus Aenigmarchaeota archaeon]